MRQPNKLMLQMVLEFFLTYGWAILIIAIVLILFFYLNIFSPLSLSPKLQPGGCKVLRPNGPNTTAGISLQGECLGLLPEFTVQLNGVNSIDVTPKSGIPNSLIGNSNITVVAWIKPTSLSNIDEPGIFFIGPANGGASASSLTISLNRDNSNIEVEAFGTDKSSTLYVPFNRWSFIAVSYNPSNHQYAVYNSVTSTTFTLPQLNIANGVIVIGKNSPDAGRGRGSMSYFGQISNVQLYNTTLSSNDIALLRQEGIGSAPVYLQHIVGWWPLNGDARDYSGNNNNGAATNVIFTGAWYANYSRG